MDLWVESAVQRGLFGFVMDDGWCSVLQQHLHNALITPASGDVQRRVPLIVLNVQPARVQVEVNQRLHTLHKPTAYFSLKSSKWNSFFEISKPYDALHLHVRTCRPGEAECCHCCPERLCSPYSATAATTRENTMKRINLQLHPYNRITPSWPKMLSLTVTPWKPFWQERCSGVRAW